ncbi:type II secretion system GspH family protein [Clostridium sp. DSM 100503]|uniref:type II secretion system protein n=1 Tax=Clostridium sp. DSM 100503 TaxID=2963282 RepID=UPI00214A6849|nr:type II secretion system protein [Clostridium sp. DSM 100503]MCR1949736.1 type II secretion system GspH family protein [Clostridium sp. DSM 100503]
MKKGSTLVESIVALGILLIAATLAVEIGIVAAKSRKIRNIKNEADRVAYAIESEIKYNVTLEELNRAFNGGKLSYNYSKDILNKLITTPILEIERGNGITLEKLNNSIFTGEKASKAILLKIRVSDEEGGILCEREFIKSYWMEKK